MTGATGPLTILMPPVDDVYELYWNGQRIGSYGSLPPNASWNFRGHSDVYPITNELGSPGDPSVEGDHHDRRSHDAGRSGGGPPDWRSGLSGTTGESNTHRAGTSGTSIAVDLRDHAGDGVDLVAALCAGEEKMAIPLAGLVSSRDGAAGSSVPGGRLVRNQLCWRAVLVAVCNLRKRFVSLGIAACALRSGPECAVETVDTRAGGYLWGRRDCRPSRIFFFWQYAGKGMVWMDAITTAIYTVAPLYIVAILIGGLRRRRQMDLWPLAIVVFLAGLWSFLLGSLSQGLQITHWDKFVAWMQQIGFSLGDYHFRMSAILNILSFVILLFTVAREQYREAAARHRWREKRIAWHEISKLLARSNAIYYPRQRLRSPDIRSQAGTRRRMKLGVTTSTGCSSLTEGSS